MVPGVASLRCPVCGRPFLTLPQQEDASVVCPHCGHMGAAAAYAAAGGTPENSLVRSLRHRTDAATPGEPTVPAHHAGAWPAAPPLFVDPKAAVEPPPPPAPRGSAPESDSSPETSRFRLSDLKTKRGRPAWQDPPAEAPERNLPLGLLLLAVALFGAWLLWLSLQPPLAAEIPALSPAAVEAGAEPVF